jgi:hypothetical protein
VAILQDFLDKFRRLFEVLKNIEIPGLFQVSKTHRKPWDGLHGLVDGWVDSWMGEWMDGWIVG